MQEPAAPVDKPAGRLPPVEAFRRGALSGIIFAGLLALVDGVQGKPFDAETTLFRFGLFTILMGAWNALAPRRWVERTQINVSAD